MTNHTNELSVKMAWSLLWNLSFDVWEAQVLPRRIHSVTARAIGRPG